LGSARLVTDARGKHFVLLEHGEGRGSHATRMYLTVFELTAYEDRGYLEERVRLLIEQPLGIHSDSIYEYRVVTPEIGGMALHGNWTMDTSVMEPWEREIAPLRNRTVLEID
jgi:hypothetical protein